MNLQASLGSNPCPFLLWIATLEEKALEKMLETQGFKTLVNELTGSNPCPFLLWIATSVDFPVVFKIVVVTLVHFYCGLRQTFNLICSFLTIICSNPCPFLLWIATLCLLLDVLTNLSCSNPCPFLLWIATSSSTERLLACLCTVVTLFHFYCGLRQCAFFYLVF